MSETWLIAGLGNPGDEYAQTRHNIGFMVVQALAEKLGISGKGDTKFNAIVGQGRLAGHKIILVQPLTYMNLSGQAIQAVSAFYKIPHDHILVIYDDIDLPFAQIRFRAEGGPGTHNGMKSIVQCLSTQQFPRMRIGVGAPPPQWDLSDYVLAKFTPEEQDALPDLITRCIQAIGDCLTKGLAETMTRYNRSASKKTI